MFDRFAACVKARPCDRDLCKRRYNNRVASEMCDDTSGRHRCAHVRLGAQLHRAEGGRGLHRVPALQFPTAVRVREDLRAEAGGGLGRRQHEGAAHAVRPRAHQGGGGLQGRLGPRRLARRRDGAGDLAGGRHQRARRRARRPLRRGRACTGKRRRSARRRRGQARPLDGYARRADDDRFLLRAAAPRLQAAGRRAYRRRQSTPNRWIRAAG